MVTHSNTSRPIQCLCMAERTGCPVFTDLWPYVMNEKTKCNIKAQCLQQSLARGDTLRLLSVRDGNPLGDVHILRRRTHAVLHDLAVG